MPAGAEPPAPSALGGFMCSASEVYQAGAFSVLPQQVRRLFSNSHLRDKKSFANSFARKSDSQNCFFTKKCPRRRVRLCVRGFHLSEHMTRPARVSFLLNLGCFRRRCASVSAPALAPWGRVRLCRLAALLVSCQRGGAPLFAPVGFERSAVLPLPLSAA